MKILSLHHTYNVVAKLRGPSGRQDLLAQDGARAQRLLVSVRDMSLQRALVPMFEHWSGYASFVDFIEAFRSEDVLYAVFAHRRDKRDRPFAEVLMDAPAPLRVKAVRSLLGGLLSQDLPWPVVCDVLRSGNLFCSASGRVTFAYHLRLHAQYDGPCADRAMVLLAETVRTAFSGLSVPVLEGFLRALESQKFPRMEEVFAAFSSISDEVGASNPTLPPEAPSLRERAKKAQSWASGKLAGIVGVAVLLCGAALLCWVLYRAVLAPAPVDNGIRAIGTVVIEEHAQP